MPQIVAGLSIHTVTAKSSPILRKKLPKKIFKNFALAIVMDSGQKSMKFLRKVLLFGHAVKFTPYRWPNFNSNVQYVTTIYRTIWQTSLLTGLISYIFFLGSQCFRAVIDPKADSREQMGVIYITSGYFLMLVNHFPQIFLGLYYVQLLNRFRAFMALQTWQHGNKRKPDVTLRESWMQNFDLKLQVAKRI